MTSITTPKPLLKLFCPHELKGVGSGGVDGFEGVDGGGHQESKRHMKEEEGSFLSRDGAGNNGLRNNLRRRQRGERKAITT